MLSNYKTGHIAEQYAAEYLKSQAYNILGLNWKNKYCEIDIVAQKAKTVHFVEVKYRKNDSQGTGLDYITDKKVKQMTFAAEIWINSSGWEGEYCLSAIELYGPEFIVSSFLAEI
jgi:putative endonuclease